jgi:hypothetical protein
MKTIKNKKYLHNRSIHKHKIIVYPKSNNTNFYESFKETTIKNGNLIKDNEIEKTNNPSLFLHKPFILLRSYQKSRKHKKNKVNQKK